MEATLIEEATIVMGEQAVERLRSIFESVKEDTNEGQKVETVEFNKLVGTVAEDRYF